MNSLEDGNEEVEEQDIGKEKVNTEHNDGQPLWEGWHVVGIEHRAFGSHRVGAINSAGGHVKFSI